MLKRGKSVQPSNQIIMQGDNDKLHPSRLDEDSATTITNGFQLQIELLASKWANLMDSEVDLNEDCSARKENDILDQIQKLREQGNLDEKLSLAVGDRDLTSNLVINDTGVPALNEKITQLLKDTIRRTCIADDFRKQVEQFCKELLRSNQCGIPSDYVALGEFIESIVRNIFDVRSRFHHSFYDDYVDHEELAVLEQIFVVSDQCKISVPQAHFTKISSKSNENIPPTNVDSGLKVCEKDNILCNGSKSPYSSMNNGFGKLQLDDCVHISDSEGEDTSALPHSTVEENAMPRHSMNLSCLTVSSSFYEILNDVDDDMPNQGTSTFDMTSSPVQFPNRMMKLSSSTTTDYKQCSARTVENETMMIERRTSCSESSTFSGDCEMLYEVNLAAAKNGRTVSGQLFAGSVEHEDCNKRNTSEVASSSSIESQNGYSELKLSFEDMIVRNDSDPPGTLPNNGFGNKQPNDHIHISDSEGEDSTKLPYPIKEERVKPRHSLDESCLTVSSSFCEILNDVDDDMPNQGTLSAAITSSPVQIQNRMMKLSSTTTTNYKQCSARTVVNQTMMIERRTSCSESSTFSGDCEILYEVKLTPARNVLSMASLQLASDSKMEKIYKQIDIYPEAGESSDDGDSCDDSDIIIDIEDNEYSDVELVEESTVHAGVFNNFNKAAQGIVEMPQIIATSDNLHKNEADVPLEGNVQSQGISKKSAGFPEASNTDQEDNLPSSSSVQDNSFCAIEDDPRATIVEADISNSKKASSSRSQLRIYDVNDDDDVEFLFEISYAEPMNKEVDLYVQNWLQEGCVPNPDPIPVEPESKRSRYDFLDATPEIIDLL